MAEKNDDVWIPIVVETGGRIYFGADTVKNAIENEQTMVGKPGDLYEALEEATRQATNHDKRRPGSEEQSY
jgi:hypothetical protein